MRELQKRDIVVAKPIDFDFANCKIYILWPAPPPPKIKDFGDPELRLAP